MPSWLRTRETSVEGQGVHCVPSWFGQDVQCVQVKGPWCAQRLEAREPRLLRWQVAWERYNGGIGGGVLTFIHADLDLAGGSPR